MDSIPVQEAMSIVVSLVRLNAESPTVFSFDPLSKVRHESAPELKALSPIVSTLAGISTADNNQVC